jgi:hypothetical protein
MAFFSRLLQGLLRCRIAVQPRATYVGATDERASRQDYGCAWTPPAGAPANPREGERNPQALFVSPLVDYEVRPATL